MDSVRRRLYSNKELQFDFLLNHIHKGSILLFSLIQKLCCNMTKTFKLLWPLSSVFTSIFAFPGLIFYFCLIIWIYSNPFHHISERKNSTKFENKKGESIWNKISSLFYCLRPSPRNNLCKIAESQRNLKTKRVNSLMKPRPPVLCN